MSVSRAASALQHGSTRVAIAAGLALAASSLSLAGSASGQAYPRTDLIRDTFCRALAAEGFPLGVGYVRPLYLLPLFQERIAIGAEGFPFSLSNRTYPKGLCPVAERLHEKEAFLFEPSPRTSNDIVPRTAALDLG